VSVSELPLSDASAKILIVQADLNINGRRPALPVSFLIQIFTISIAAIMVRFSITVFLAVYAVPALGHPHLQLRQPIGFLDNNPAEPALTPRASTDPACPDGYLCGQESCSSGVECPIGTNCIAFGSGLGTAACAPLGKRYCALETSTFLAVECPVDMICW